MLVARLGERLQLRQPCQNGICIRRHSGAGRAPCAVARLASRSYAGPDSRGARPASAAPPQQPARRGSLPSPVDVFLPRSLLVDKEVITRTSGKRLGYITQLYVDPIQLEVVSVYLRPGVTSLGAGPSTDHVLLSSLRQIGDVVLVHDESALLDPPADEAYGYVKLVGTEVQTEDGVSLGKVRDYVFNPDTGAVSTIKMDALGLPSIPQALLACSSLGWEEIVAVGPTRVVVRRGADLRAIRENDSWVGDGISALLSILTGLQEEESAMTATATLDADRYRADDAYLAWYAQYGQDYQQYYGMKLPKPVVQPRQQQQARQAPRALPPPQSTPYNQALRQQDRMRQAVPAGAGRGPPPPGMQLRQQPPPQQQPQQQQQQQQFQPRPQSQPPGRPAPPRQPAARPEGALPPQNGIPIIDRRPRPNYQRRDADGGYGERPGQGSMQEGQRGLPPGSAEAGRQPGGSPQSPTPGRPDPVRPPYQP